MTATARPDQIAVVQTIATLDRVDGGTSTAVSNLADALADAGLAVSVVFTAGEDASATLLPQRARTLAVRAMRVGRRILWPKGYAAAIGRACGAHERRLIHDNGLWGVTNIIAARCAARAQIPLVISPHGMLEPWAMGYRRWRKRLAMALGQRAMLESAALFIVTSESEAQSVRRAGLRQPIAIVPLGIFLPTQRAAHSMVAPMRRMLFLSRIHPKKGLELLIEAWSRVRRPGWKIVVAGPDEGGHQAQLQRLLELRGVAADFEFVGEVSGRSKEQLFQAADLFILPTHSENFGLVVAEAMSYELPVLTTQGTPWEVLESVGAGWWVEPSVDGIEQGLRSALATTPEARAAMGRAGRQYAERHLTWQAAGQQTFEAYDWLLSDRLRIPPHVRLFAAPGD